jgi:hypothetical protein
MSQFRECTSLSISYDNLGLATVNYTIVSDTSNPSIATSITAGGQTFTGYVTNLSINYIPGTSWYETQVSLITTTA